MLCQSNVKRKIRKFLSTIRVFLSRHVKYRYAHVHILFANVKIFINDLSFKYRQILFYIDNRPTLSLTTHNNFHFPTSRSLIERVFLKTSVVLDRPMQIDGNGAIESWRSPMRIARGARDRHSLSKPFSYRDRFVVTIWIASWLLPSSACMYHVYIRWIAVQPRRILPLSRKIIPPFTIFPIQMFNAFSFVFPDSVYLTRVVNFTFPWKRVQRREKVMRKKRCLNKEGENTNVCMIRFNEMARDR